MKILELAHACIRVHGNSKLIKTSYLFCLAIYSFCLEKYSYCWAKYSFCWAKYYSARQKEHFARQSSSILQGKKTGNFFREGERDIFGWFNFISLSAFQHKNNLSRKLLHNTTTVVLMWSLSIIFDMFRAPRRIQNRRT